MSVRFQLGPRGQAVLVLALVATIGALAGVMADRVLAQRSDLATVPQPAFRTPVAGGRGSGPTAAPRGAPARGEARVGMRYAERLETVVQLTAEQKHAIDSIMTEQHRRVRELTSELEPRFQQIAQEARASVEAVLTPEQRVRMQAVRQQRARR